MKLKDQVVSLKLAKKLKDLGVKKSESIFLWGLDVVEGWCISLREIQEPDTKDCIAAFTVAEMGEMLPKGYRSYFYDEHPSGGTWLCNNGENVGSAHKTEADSRAAMLIHLIEQGLIPPQEAKA